MGRLLWIRAIFCGLGCAADPDVEDYYDKARAFPIVYSPSDDPEVMEDMQVAAAELAAGEANDEDANGEAREISSQSSDDGEVGGDGADGEWVDDEVLVGTAGRKKKVFSCIDKVRRSSLFTEHSSNKRVNVASCCRC